jgi:organic hydroperoxide reductase OsmC/OhrA
VRATFRNTEKYDVDDAPPYFEEVVVRVEVESPASPDQVRRLIDHAERACHAAQSLRHPIPVRLEARLNGDQLEPKRDE